MPFPIRIESLNVGKPRELVSPGGRAFTSSIDRKPAEGPVTLGEGGLEGDACSYKGHHGPYMAVNAFAAESYPRVAHWARRDLPVPAFGENLTLGGLPDAEARAGDVLQAPGGAVLQVTQPREPCGNIALFLGVERIVDWMRDQPLTGYYLKVVEGGMLEAGAELQLVERGPAEWTIERLNRAMFEEIGDLDLVAHLESLEVISPNWRRSLRRQADAAARRAARKGD